MSWTLFLDDERDYKTTYPRERDDIWVARSTKEAIALVGKYGYPELMLLDHDLGGEDTTMEFLRWLSNVFEPQFDCIPNYRIHSANPVGVANIQSFMESWKRSLQ